MVERYNEIIILLSCHLPLEFLLTYQILFFPRISDWYLENYCPGVWEAVIDKKKYIKKIYVVTHIHISTIWSPVCLKNISSLLSDHRTSSARLLSETNLFYLIEKIKGSYSKSPCWPSPSQTVSWWHSIHQSSSDHRFSDTKQDSWREENWAWLLSCKGGAGRGAQPAAWGLAGALRLPRHCSCLCSLHDLFR